MAVTLNSYCLFGLNAVPVKIQVDSGQGMPIFNIIGMAGASVKESRDRVRSALSHSGFKFPLSRKVVNLAPAEIPKTGNHFDLPIAIGLLCSSGQIKETPKDLMIIGELGLEGGVSAVRGIIPGLIFAKESKIKRVVLPLSNVREASLVEDLELIPVKSLSECVEYLKNGVVKNNFEKMELSEEASLYDFKHIRGQAATKRALLVAAAGGHHLLMSGPPGSGKSMMGKTFLSILPALSKDEALEVLKIFSVAGKNNHKLNLTRPFRTVHSSSSGIVLTGGGVNLSPGEVTLAHRGVLYLDELPEFSRIAIESLRQSLEEKEIVIRRAHNITSYPCQFQLIATMNPCPCGFYGDTKKSCVCLPSQVARYEQKISGPILDRIDIHIEVPRISYDELSESHSVSSTEMRKKVEGARERQRARLKANGLYLNQEMTPKLIKEEKLDQKSTEILKKAADNYSLSGRAIHRLIKVARTIADLDGKDTIENSHLFEAIQYRIKEA